MSSFDKKFGNQQSDKYLQYDNTAFLHFSISIGVLAIGYLVFSLIHQLFFNRRSKILRKVGANPLFSRQATVERQIQSKKIRERSVFLKLIAIVALVGSTCWALKQVGQEENRIKGFDPYELLGVDINTPIQKIRKAYRKLALVLHPDRNPNNFEAASKFIMISKAYECLTDEKVKANCEKYGNPDGQESFKIGIALPSFLIQKDNNNLVLFWIFAVFILLLPKLFHNLNVKLEARNERGLIQDNFEAIYSEMIEQLTRERLDLAISRMKQVTDPKLEIIRAGTIKRTREGQEEKEEQIIITESMRNNLEVLEKFRKKELFQDYLLQKMPELIREIIVFGLEFFKKDKKKAIYQASNQIKLIVPFMGIGQFQRIIRYSQELYQNHPRTEHSLNQLSLTEEQQTEFGKTLSIHKLVKQVEARNSLLQKITDSKRKEILSKQIRCLPNLTLETVTMAGKQIEDTFTDKDIVGFKFKIKRQFSEQNPLGLAYLKEYPFFKNEKYYLTMSYNGTMVFFEEVTLQPGTIYEAGYNYIHRGPPMTMIFKAELYSDCYFGLDLQQTILVKFVQFQGSLKIKFHPIDRKIQRLPMNALEEVFYLDINGAGEDEILSDTQQKEEEMVEPNQPHHQIGHCCEHHHHEEEIKQQIQEPSSQQQHQMHDHPQGQQECENQEQEEGEGEDAQEQWVDED